MVTQLPFILETERLGIRRLTLSDADFIIALLNSEGWLKYIGNRFISDKAAAENYLLQGPLKAYEDYGYGLYCVVEKSSATAIGMCGILNRATLEQPDLGFAFLPKYMGKGYAFEAAEAIVSKKNIPEKIEELFAITLSNNSASIGLLLKLGFAYKKDIQLPDDSDVLQLYVLKISRD